MSNRLVTERTQTHFDAIALKLDWWAQRNQYYYQDLDRLYQFLIPTGSTVSVIIPARNEAGNIATAIERLPQLGKHTEVIFVEGHSQDDTLAQIQDLIREYRGNLTIRAGSPANMVISLAYLNNWSKAEII